MKDYFLVSSLAACLGLSAVLFLKNKELAAKYNSNSAQLRSELYRTTISEDLWMRSVDYKSTGGSGINYDEKIIKVLIIFGERGGCTACLELELNDWSAFFEHAEMANKASIKLICTVGDVERKRQEFKSMRISLPIFFDNSAALINELDIGRTPRILFLYKGRLIGGYTAEMGNRQKSKLMIKKLDEFITLIAERK